MGKPGFVPRPGRRRRTVRPLGWDTAVSTWAATEWNLTATVWAAELTPQRRAQTQLARRVTKKAATVTVAAHPGGVLTGRPVGTRMGKGKGKPVGHRRWCCPGGVTHRVRTHPGGVPALAGLTPRSSAKVKATPAGW